MSMSIGCRLFSARKLDKIWTNGSFAFNSFKKLHVQKKLPVVVKSSPNKNLNLLKLPSKSFDYFQRLGSPLSAGGGGGVVEKRSTKGGSSTKRKKAEKAASEEESGSPSTSTSPLTFPIVAYASCEELKLEALLKGLEKQKLYIPTSWPEELEMENVIHVTAKYIIGDEPREIFFFREGVIVFWNVSDLERLNVLRFIKDYEEESYEENEMMDESEYMLYTNVDQNPSRLHKGKIHLNQDSEESLLEKYTFANAMALSVKLGIWESTLDHFVESIEHITDELKRSEKLKITRSAVLQKTGELFALRHKLNLNSDLLDTPDFYWERERLEVLYHKMYNYLSIPRRTSVLNEKLSQCCELLELISSHLNDEHHVRLEWMIIALIMIEVGFEILHLVERFI